MPRIPNAVLKGRYSLENIPERYVLGPGHVRFFYNKLAFLAARYKVLHDEADARGFSVDWRFPEDLPSSLYNDYVPTSDEIAVNRSRIEDRLSKMKPRWRSYAIVI